MLLPKPNDYSEYWGQQVQLVRLLQTNGLKVDVKDRLPLFRLFIVINQRMTGVRKDNLVSLINGLISMRMKGLEPKHNGKRYL